MPRHRHTGESRYPVPGPLDSTHAGVSDRHHFHTLVCRSQPGMGGSRERGRHLSDDAPNCVGAGAWAQMAPNPPPPSFPRRACPRGGGGGNPSPARCAITTPEPVCHAARSDQVVNLGGPGSLTSTNARAIILPMRNPPLASAPYGAAAFSALDPVSILLKPALPAFICGSRAFQNPPKCPSLQIRKGAEWNTLKRFFGGGFPSRLSGRLHMIPLHCAGNTCAEHQCGNQSWIPRLRSCRPAP